MTWTTVFELSLAPAAASGALLYYASAVPRSQLFGPALVRGPRDGRCVALTFDDGPAPPFTGQILDILRDRKVPAAFFVCGRNVERFPQILLQIQAENHTIGNHTYSHPFLYMKSRKRIAEEIDRTQEIIERVTGQRPTIFRPPCGVRWFGLYPVLRERRLRLIQWSDTGFDWRERYTPDDIVRATLKNLDSGGIILLHDGYNAFPPDRVDRSKTVAALPAIIQGARKAGLTFVPLPQFLLEQASR